MFRRILPAMMRCTSRMSEISPAENRVQGCPQLVRQRRQELVLDASGFLCGGTSLACFVGIALRDFEKLRVIECQRRARGASASRAS